MTIVEGMKNVASHVVLVLWKFSLDISRLSALLFLKVEEISAGGGLEECFQKTCCPITSTRLFAQNESVTSLSISFEIGFHHHFQESFLPLFDKY